MNELQRIEKQLQRAFDGGAWHGPAVLELLEGVDEKMASAHPIAGGHSIWELVLHIAAWERACLRRLNGDRAQLTDAEDWPQAGEATAKAWQSAREQLVQGHQDLRRRLSTVAESTLDQPILEGLATVYETIHGVVQHDLYHAGQIALLKRAAATEVNNG